MPAEIINVVGNIDISAILQKPDKASDPRRNVCLVDLLVRRITRAVAPMLLETLHNAVVERAKGDPALIQPMQKVPNPRTVQDRTCRPFDRERGEECGE